MMSVCQIVDWKVKRQLTHARYGRFPLGSILSIVDLRLPAVADT